MAQYTINHACGHTATARLFGPHKERERKLEWLSGRECEDCYRTRRDAERGAAAAKAADAAESNGLPELHGSPKQISWAETIRAGLIDQLERIEARMEASDTQIDAGALAAFGAVERRLRTEQSCRWWIDNRSASVADLTRAEHAQLTCCEAK